MVGFIAFFPMNLLLNVRDSLVAQTVKCLPAMQETRVWSPGREDPLEKEMATNSSTLAYKIPWVEEPVGYSPWGRKESDRTEQIHFLIKQLHDFGWTTEISGLSFPI